MKKRKLKMDRKAREMAVRNVAAEYRKASKKRRGQILDVLCEQTGCARKYLISKLSSMTATVSSWDFNGERVKKVVVKNPAASRGGRPRTYDEAFSITLVKIWTFFDRVCGERLVVIIRNNIESLAKHEEFMISDDIKGKLARISPATCDRLLMLERARYSRHGISGTLGAGSSLNKLIPIKVGYGMDERDKAGIFEVDTVAHCGFGDQKTCLWTLTLTDISNGMTFIRVLGAKTQRNVLSAMDSIVEDCPYPIAQLHIDNGSEAKNYGFLHWASIHGAAVVRSRSYHKNDNCFVEQKNYSVVRNCVGYYRYAGGDALDAMEEAYWYYERLVNLFLPSAKLLEKERIDAHTYKRYDEPRTPYERILRDASVGDDAKRKLQEYRESFDVVNLKQGYDKALCELLAFRCREGKIETSKSS